MNDELKNHRIHIIGGPGSGKSTLARQIAGIAGAPLHELDMTGYENGAGAKRPLDIKLADVHAIAAQPAWVTEGTFLWWTDDLLRAADLIVWLDPPAHVALWRIVSRHIRTSLAATNRHRGMRSLILFLRNAHDYYRSEARTSSAQDDDSSATRAATKMALAGFDHKVVRCQRHAEITTLLQTLEDGHSQDASNDD